MVSPALVAIPQRVPKELRDARRAELAATRSRWAWSLDDRTLPPRLARVPGDERPTSGMIELVRTLGRLLFVMARGQLRRFRARLGKRRTAPFERFGALFVPSDLPALAARWRTDEEFAMQRLNGLWPDHIARCTAVPEDLALADDAIAGLVPPGETLRSLADQGLLYAVDQRILAELPQAKDHVTAAPLCLFWSDVERGRLMPLAVKLGCEKDAPIFTPRDPPGLWLAAKAFANNADLVVHVAVKHFLRMHFAMEAFYASMVRNLSRRHPVHAFVRPHFFLTLFANANVRDKVLRDRDWWLARRAWPAWTFAELDVPGDFRRRGVDDPAKLPSFHFRDESLALWGAFDEHVRGVVHAIYASDEEVAGDDELQAWMAELRDPEVCAFRDLPLDADGRMTTREELVRLLGPVLFNVTVRHNHNTNVGRQYYAYTPNTPLFLRLPIPTTKRDVPEDVLSDAMPTQGEAVKVIAEIESVQNLPGTFNVLGRESEAFVAAFPAGREHVERFRARLVAIEEEMKRRDAARAIPYPYLYPSLIANSVWS